MIASDVENFIETFAVLVSVDSTGECVKTSRYGNLLHLLVEYATHRSLSRVDEQSIRLIPLIKHLVQLNPALLKQASDKNGSNPLLQAIKAPLPRRWNLADRGIAQDRSVLAVNMVLGCDNPEATPLHRRCLDAALQMKSEQDGGKTSLHLAFEQRLSHELLEMLLKNASHETLAVQDKYGQTPMHYAIRFDDLSDARLSIVRLFLQKDREARKYLSGHGVLFLDIVNKHGFSVYREHEDSRQYALTSPGPRVSKREVIEKSRSSELRNRSAISAIGRVPRVGVPARASQKVPLSNLRNFGNTHTGRDDDEKEEPLEGRENLRLDKKRQQEEERERKQKEMVMEEEHTTQSDPFQSREVERGDAAMTARIAVEDSSIKSKDQQSSDGWTLTNLEGFERMRLDNTPAKSIKQSPTAPQEVLDEETWETRRMEALNRNSATILLELKLHYLRTRDEELAIAFLYGKNSEGEHDIDCET